MILKNIRSCFKVIIILSTKKKNYDNGTYPFVRLWHIRKPKRLRGTCCWLDDAKLTGSTDLVCRQSEVLSCVYVSARASVLVRPLGSHSGTLSLLAVYFQSSFDKLQHYQLAPSVSSNKLEANLFKKEKKGEALKRTII